MPACSFSCYVVFNVFRLRLCYVVIFIPVVGARFSSKGDMLWLVSPNTKGETFLTPRMTCVQKIRAPILRGIEGGPYLKIAKLASLRDKTSMDDNLLVGLYHSCYLHIVNRNRLTTPDNLSVVITNRPTAHVKATNLNLPHGLTFLLPKQSGRRNRSVWMK